MSSMSNHIPWRSSRKAVSVATPPTGHTIVGNTLPCASLWRALEPTPTVVVGLGTCGYQSHLSSSPPPWTSSGHHWTSSPTQTITNSLAYRCTFVLCLIGRPKAHNFWHGPYLARPNLIVGLGRHGPHCGPCLGLKSSPRAGLARPI